MPLRKSDSSETKADSRRSSLRRLSSIASLHSLNPFHRRRSGQTTSFITDTPPSVSNTSPASTATKDLSSSYHSAEREAGLESHPRPPLPSHHAARRSSYVCLPDDPIGGMPRSRTFSNLPLPIRTTKSTGGLLPARSHARLPPALLPSTRLPSPRMSTRKHSLTRLANLDSNAVPNRKRLPRSDTEPLLQTGLDHAHGGTRRSTAFKENISFSPIRPLPSTELLDEDDFHRSGWPSSHQKIRSMLSPSNTLSSSTLSLAKYAELPDAAHKRLTQKYDGNPLYQNRKERKPTPGPPVQRWNSQPVLTSHSEKRSSHGEIKQPRLMSALQAPTLPPSKTPLGGEALPQTKLKTSTRSSHLRQTSEKLPKSRVEAPGPRPQAQSIKAGTAAVHCAEPFAYWTGRFSSLNDRYRNEDLTTSLRLPSTSSFSNLLSTSNSSSDWTPKKETDKMHTLEANTARMRRAIVALYGSCATDEARMSFLRWQKQVAAALNLPELGRPVAGSKSCALEMTLVEREDVSDHASTPLSHGRRINFMDRLLGKKQKILSSG